MAVSLAAKIETVLNCRVTLIPEGRGVFDVVVDDKLIYSKHQTGSFPNEDQLINELSAM